MKKLKLAFLLFAVPCLLLTGQETGKSKSRVHELGISYGGLNLLGVRYKFGTENALVRLTILSGGGTRDSHKDNNSEIKNTTTGFGLNAGFQKSKPVADNVFFYFGADLMAALENHSYEDAISVYKDTDRSVSTGFACVLGFACYFSDNVSLSAEILPSIWTTTTKSTFLHGATKETSTSKLFGYGFNRDWNSYANLTLSFRLNPKK